MIFPYRLLVSKIAFERFLAPWAVDWVRDGGKRRNGLVFAGILQELHVQLSALSSS